MTSPRIFVGWRKSSHSKDSEECVEAGAGRHGDEVGVRDTKQPGGPVLVVPVGAWRAFTRQVKEGRHDVRAAR